jgi:hypothetical protein
MAPLAPAPHWSRSIGTGGRDPSEWVVAIVGMRSQILDVGEPDVEGSQIPKFLDRVRIGHLDS